MSAEIIHTTFDWSAHQTRGRQRIVVAPGESAVLDARNVLQATVERDGDRLLAQVDVFNPVRPTAHLTLAVGRIVRVGPFSLYLRAVTYADGWPASLTFDVQALDDRCGAWEQSL